MCSGHVSTHMERCSDEEGGHDVHVNSSEQVAQVASHVVQRRPSANIPDGQADMHVLLNRSGDEGWHVVQVVALPMQDEHGDVHGTHEPVGARNDVWGHERQLCSSPDEHEAQLEWHDAQRPSMAKVPAGHEATQAPFKSSEPGKHATHEADAAEEHDAQLASAHAEQEPSPTSKCPTAHEVQSVAAPPVHDAHESWHAVHCEPSANVPEGHERRYHVIDPRPPGAPTARKALLTATPLPMCDAALPACSKTCA